MSADLVIFVGQYCMPSPGEYRFSPEIKAIQCIRCRKTWGATGR